MLYREIIAVCSQIHTKHINTLCEQNVELLNIKPGLTRSNRLRFKQLITTYQLSTCKTRCTVTWRDLVPRFCVVFLVMYSNWEINTHLHTVSRRPLRSDLNSPSHLRRHNIWFQFATHNSTHCIPYTLCTQYVSTYKNLHQKKNPMLRRNPTGKHGWPWGRKLIKHISLFYIDTNELCTGMSPQ